MGRGVRSRVFPTLPRGTVVLPVDAYLLTGLAMCAVLLVALAGTAYLAVFFNRRAKDDLTAAFTPLAKRMDGSFELDNAEIRGAYQNYPVFARMANATEGPGRVFQVDVLDAAGGDLWQYTSNPPTKREPERTVEFEGDDEIRQIVKPAIETESRRFLDPDIERFRVEYLPREGVVRLVRAMRSRRDIPDAGTLASELDMLTGIAGRNRAWVESRNGGEVRA
ncbi:MAG TPA: hypothetical protein VGR22_10155 [Thermomicrobiales bacterium]|nr:hypothetical protein [Thermomicrobiales bacterium]